MLRITPSTSPDGAKKYFTQSLTRDDTGYYHEGQELAGQWGGKGAAMLGLEGAVSQRDYFALCDNRHPETGERITPRNKEGRRIGFDFTFSAPKSVSVLYELTGDERILDAHRESIRETMADIEGEMKTRVRVRGADHDRETGNMVFAEFTHFTARPVGGMPDPHLHTHVYAFNLTHDSKENRWKAGQFGDLKRDGQFWEASYDARFAHRLQAMGIATEKRGLSFEIAGAPQSVIDKNSRRRNVIVSNAAEKGITDTKGKHDQTDFEFAEASLVRNPSFREVLSVGFSLPTLILCLMYFSSFGAELAIESNLSSFYIKMSGKPAWSQTLAANWAAMYGLLNVVMRPLGGYISDCLYPVAGVEGKKFWLITCKALTSPFTTPNAFSLLTLWKA